MKLTLPFLFVEALALSLLCPDDRRVASNEKEVVALINLTTARTTHYFIITASR